MILDKIGIRRLTLAVQQHTKNVLANYAFEANDEYLRQHIAYDVTTYLDMLCRRGAVSIYNVICDETNNPPSVVDANDIVVDVYLTPTRSVDSIMFRATLTPDDMIWDAPVGINHGMVNSVDEDTTKLHKAFERAMKVVDKF